MTQLKIIPRKPMSLSDAKQYPSFEVFDASNALFSQYIQFIETWGGGNVFPCAMPLPEGVSSRTGQKRAVIIQSLIDPMRASDDHNNGLRGEYWTDDYRPIARMNQGDQVLMKVANGDIGTIHYWTQKKDGLNYTIAKVADDFHSFLGLLYHDKKLGSTNPWTRMKSEHDAPAIDFTY